MIYITKQVTFKKQSETLNTIIKDKEIQTKKKQIKTLVKSHMLIQTELMSNKENYEKLKQNYEKQHQQLIKEEKIAKQSLFKLKIRKLRLEVFQKPEIQHQFGNTLKKYLKGWKQNKKISFILSMGGTVNCQIARKFVIKMETIFYIKPQIKNMIIMKQMNLWVNPNRQQKIFFVVKKDMNGQSYHLSIYSITGKYFYIEREINEKDFALISKENPLKNLIVWPEKKQIQFLTQYLSDLQKLHKAENSIRILRFFLNTMREAKKVIYFKRIPITNIFESVYCVPGYQNITIDSYIMIKKNENIQSQKQFSSTSISNSVSNYRTMDSKIQQEQSSMYTFYCGPVKKYKKQFNFFFHDDQILKNFYQNPKQFIQIFLTDYLLQIKCSQKVNTQKTERANEFMSNSNRFFQNKQYKSGNFYEYKEQPSKSVNCLIKPKIKKIINFQQTSNMKKIIKIQSTIKMCLQRKNYKTNLNQAKQRQQFSFKCKISSNIICSTFIKNQSVIFLVECLSLSKQKFNTKGNFLKYSKKYYKLGQKFIDSSQFSSIMNKTLVQQIENQIQTRFEERILDYQGELEKLELQKPMKMYNRLRRLFIKVCLRRKIKKNVLYLGKIEKQFAKMILIFRRSSFVKNIIDVNLYILISKQQEKEQEDGEKKRQSILKKINEESLIKYKPDRISKIRYKTINLFSNSTEMFIEKSKKLSKFTSQKSAETSKAISKNIQSQFYITQNYFILKPLHIEYITGEYKFIQRFTCLNVSSEELLTQINNFSQLKNSIDTYTTEQKRKTFLENKSFRNDLNSSSSSIVFEKQISDRSYQPEFKQQNIIFYSLYKNNKNMFFLELFVIDTNKKTDTFKEIHKQELNKKDIQISGWSFIYKIIAFWVIESGLFTIQDLQRKNYDKNGNGFVVGSIGGLRQNQKESQDGIIEGETQSQI